MSFPIVGAHFRPPAKGILAALPAGATLWAIPEPENPYDSNAIKIVIKTKDFPPDSLDNIAVHTSGFGTSKEELLAADEWHLGYIPRDLAAWLASRFAGEPREASLTFDLAGKPRVDIPGLDDEA